MGKTYLSTALGIEAIQKHRVAGFKYVLRVLCVRWWL